MNILLWVLQGFLAFFCFSGGSYKLSKRDQRPKYMAAGTWVFLGALEVVCAVGLVVPVAVPVAALLLVLEGLYLTLLFGSKNTKFIKTNPTYYALFELILAVWVAYGRFVLSPL